MGEEYLLVGALLVLGLGAAMLAGTAAAMVRVKRTGRAPGGDKEVTALATPGVVGRLVLGAAIVAGGVWGVWAYFT
ncbi:MAG: hypothetical protein BRC32_01340 [Actinobacteria bacterium QS_8_72_14]|nr:MAG: hypothetical protein BRC32_01340 [Actinobacteria bacterium QS_8_72_14]